MAARQFRAKSPPVENPQTVSPGQDQATTPGQVPPSAVGAIIADALRHHRAGRASQAEQLYRQALTLDASHADAWNLFGLLLLETGRPALAVDLLRRAVAINGTVASYRSNLGNALKASGQLNQAIASYCDALAIRPDDPLALTNLGAALWQQGQFDKAAIFCQSAVELAPDLAEAHNNLGNAIKDLAGTAGAIGCYRRAIECRPDFLVARNNLGNALVGIGRLDQALDVFREALDLHPDSADTHYNLALALLAQGDFAEGWIEHEWRWKTPRMPADFRAFPQPQWRGEAAAGRTLLIHAEQGFGDTLQFCRYASLAASRGLRVVLAVPKPLVRLLRDLDGVALLLEHGEPPPPFDLHCPMLSLPLALGTTLATIPGPAPYLHADAARAAFWRARLGAMSSQGPRIGLAWAGNPTLANDRRRSLPPERLAPLFKRPGLHFFSLQKGGPCADAGFALTDVMDEMIDFAETAALIANLDLVISVDTAVAHLAAALGKPVWLLDRFDPCWRWFRGRRDSPWYPTLRIYRQASPNAWDAVVAEVARDLSRLTAEPIAEPAA